jgi:hypothetical protein
MPPVPKRDSRRRDFIQPRAPPNNSLSIALQSQHNSTMAPSEKVIFAEIKSIIDDIYSRPEDRPSLTVKNVRNQVEQKLALDEGFFVQDAWKEKSKNLIKSYAVGCKAIVPSTSANKFIFKVEVIAKHEEEEEMNSVSIEVKPEPEKKYAPTPAPTKIESAKKGTKRASRESKAPPRKRQKKEETPSEDEDKESSDLSNLSDSSPEESAVSEFDDSEDEKPKKKSKSKSKSRTPVKRQLKKKAKVESDEDEELGLVSGESDNSDVPKRKRQSKAKSKATAKRQSKSKAKSKLEADEDEGEGDASDVFFGGKHEGSDATPKKSTPRKSTPKKPTKTESNGESGDEKPKNKTEYPQKEATLKILLKKALSDNEENKLDSKTLTDAGSESEMSVVLDEAPKPKRKRRSKSDMASSIPSKPAKGKKDKASKPPKATTASKDLSPDEELISTLKYQLKKCGMNKIWQFELKQYGDDNRAKIKHLQGVLKEIGMAGRFSEARAREIKEIRELQADLEAVKEGEKSWGLESGRRASRGLVKKNLRESTVEDDDEEGENDKGGTDGDESRSLSDQPRARKPRARADLAFLGDEDSDE